MYTSLTLLQYNVDHRAEGYPKRHIRPRQEHAPLDPTHPQELHARMLLYQSNLLTSPGAAVAMPQVKVTTRPLLFVRRDLLRDIPRQSDEQRLRGKLQRPHTDFLKPSSAELIIIQDIPRKRFINLITIISPLPHPHYHKNSPPDSNPPSNPNHTQSNSHQSPPRA